MFTNPQTCSRLAGGRHACLAYLSACAQTQNPMQASGWWPLAHLHVHIPAAGLHMIGRFVWHNCPHIHKPASPQQACGESTDLSGILVCTSTNLQTRSRLADDRQTCSASLSAYAQTTTSSRLVAFGTFACALTYRRLADGRLICLAYLSACPQSCMPAPGFHVVAVIVFLIWHIVWQTLSAYMPQQTRNRSACCGQGLT